MSRDSGGESLMLGQGEWATSDQTADMWRRGANTPGVWERRKHYRATGKPAAPSVRTRFESKIMRST